MRLARIFQITRRCFSTDKIRIYGPTGKYAHALFDAAKANNLQLTNVQQSLKKWKSVLESDPQLRMYINDPTLSDSEKIGTVEKHIFPTLDIEPLSKDFLSVLYGDGDGDLLKEIETDFERLVQDDLGEIKAVVTSAMQLENSHKQQIKEKLKTMVPGQKIDMVTKVDPNILGGLIVSVGDKIQDLSVRGAIQKLETDLRML